MGRSRPQLTPRGRLSESTRDEKRSGAGDGRWRVRTRRASYPTAKRMIRPRLRRQARRGCAGRRVDGSPTVPLRPTPVGAFVPRVRAAPGISVDPAVGTFLVSRYGGTRRVRNTFALTSAGQRLPPSTASRLRTMPVVRCARSAPARATRWRSWTTSGRRRCVGRFAKRDDDHVREEAAVAVGRVGDPNAMDDLVAALQEDRSQHVPRRRWACSATRARSSSRGRHGGPARRRCPGPSHARRGGGRRGPAGCGGVATERSPGR
jgi:hypothetical protein